MRMPMQSPQTVRCPVRDVGRCAVLLGVLGSPGVLVLVLEVWWLMQAERGCVLVPTAGEGAEEERMLSTIGCGPEQFVEN